MDDQEIQFEPIIDFEPIKEQPSDSFGLLDRVLSGLHSVDQFFTPEPFKDKPADFVGPQQQKPLGPGFQQIPGVENAAKWLADKIDPPLGEGGYLRGFGAGALQGLAGLLSSGGDPRAVGIKPNAPLPQIFEGPLPQVKQVGPRGLLERSNPTGPDIRSGGTRFLSGESGVAEAGKSYPMNTGPVNPSMMGEGPTGTVLDRELGDITRIPADQAARTGLTLGRPYIEPPPKPIVKPPNNQRLLERANIAKPAIRLPEESWRDRLQDEDEQPQFMAKVGDKKAQISVNVKRSAKELTTGYSTPLPGIMVREGLQNAFDVIKSMPGGGEVKIAIKDDGIEIRDNGRGMSPDELYTVYTNLHESGKTNEIGATGGKGVGKAPYMLGGKNFQVITVKDIGGQKIQSSFGGAPEQLMEPFDIQSDVVSPDTPVGTWFRTEFAPGQERYEANSMLRNITQYSRDLPGTLRAEKYGYEDIEPLKTRSNDKTILDEYLDNGNNRVQIMIPHDEKLESRNNMTIHYLNNGMYQFSKYKYIGEDVPGLPDNLLVDINPQVEEGHERYPFPVQRESIKEGLQKEIDDLIDQKMINKEKARKSIDLQKLWNSMPVISKKSLSGRELTFFDPGNRLSQEELNDMTNHPIVQQIGDLIDFTINDILDKSGETKWIKRVGRVGITLDPNMYGVHIPNPANPRESSAILINPFQHMVDSTPREAALDTVVTMLHEVAHVGMDDVTTLSKFDPSDLSDPRVGRFLESYMKQVLSQGGLDMGHGMKFVHRLGDIYARYGTKNSLQAATDIERIITEGVAGQYSPEVQRILSIYQESRGREATTEDILSGTGVKSKVGRAGKRNNAGDDNAARAGNALTKLIDAIASARPAREAQEQSYSEERSERIKNAGKVKQKGLKGFKRQLEKLRGPYRKVDFEAIQPKMESKEIDALIDLISSARLMPWEQIRTKIALLKTIQGDLPQDNELLLLERVFGKQLPDAILQLHAGVPLTRTALAEVSGIAKSLKSAFDLSAAFRQGIALVHKKEFWSAFKDMFGLIPSESYKASQEALKQRDLYDFGHKSGLYLADISDSKYKGKEEAFPSKVLSRGAYNPIGASERAYTAFLNQLRANTFDRIIMEEGKVVTDIADMYKLGKETAQFVNEASGRGSLDFSSGEKGSFGNFEKSAVELNALFYSPRLMSSRVRILSKVLDPRFYTQLNPRVRREYIKALLAIGGFGTLVGLAARQMGGADVSLNPTSADFGKIKFGPSRLDPFGGFQQYVVLINKLVAGQSTSTTSGITREFGTGPVAGNRWNTLDQFRRNKMSPIMSFAEDWLRGSNSLGEKWDTSKEVMNLFEPMIAQDAMDLYKENPDYFWLIGPDALGMGVQTYENKETGGLRPLTSGQKELQPLR